ncbi:hypothetical protein [Halobacterium jilantaiense]|uniref:Lipoprotein n=1 Tax=Halobacterium jilantaiense TaxID=355548 RepID=A0A1I0QR64_9EURY|nr:hypothetical protein [Halobacterium jilantaiense]SEW29813.1 hypothetical protein SAMN04487945_2865 [Halobacterium jilantaiense]
MRRLLLTVAVAALLVTAGCSGADGPATTATTDATEPTATPATTTVGPPEYPAGVSADGIENVSALVDAHRAHVVEHGAVLDSVTDTSGTVGNRSVAVEASETAVLSPNATYFSWTLDGSRTVNGTSETTLDESFWANDSVLVSRVATTGNVTIRTRNRTGISDDVVVNAGVKDRVLEAALSNANYTVSGTEYVDGRWRTTLESVNDTYSGQRPLVEFDATIVVASSGRVLSMERGWVRETERSRSRHRDEFTWSPTEPVERADWVPANASADT